ncbi:MAG: hypothetical protein HYU64_10150 [Armatimonadetes bacterium]|nr:hypothetical protein [Armatimonadota bacterium]
MSNLSVLPSLTGQTGSALSSRPTLVEKVKSESNGTADILFSAGIRAAVTSMDAVVVADAVSKPGMNQGGGSLGAWMMGFGHTVVGGLMVADGLARAGVYDSDPAKMEALTGAGDVMTGIGLLGQALVGGTSMVPVTMIGIGLSAIGTAGWILTSQR